MVVRHLVLAGQEAQVEVAMVVDAVVHLGRAPTALAAAAVVHIQVTEPMVAPV